MKQNEELRAATLEELEAMRQEKRREMFTLVNEQKMNKRLEKPHLKTALRRQIARINTHIRQKSAAAS